jgi:GTP pyrophosphokinase
MRQLGIPFAEREKLYELFKTDSLEEFYMLIGSGEITINQIAMRLAAQQQQPKVTEVAPIRETTTSDVKVRGVGNLLTQLARCCNPVPGDEIIGYVTRSRGVSVHRQDCYNVINEDEKDRLVPVEWGTTSSLYPVQVQVQARDRVGLMRDITTLVAEEKLNIVAVNLTNNDDYTISIFLSLEASNLAQLSRLLVKIEGVKEVISATRIGMGVPAKSATSSEVVHSQSINTIT